MADTTRSRRTGQTTTALTMRPPTTAVGRGTDAPSSWALGDGQAIPWEYAPAPESRDVVSLKARYGLFVGGKEVAPRSGEWFTTIDPATEEPLAEVARDEGCEVISLPDPRGRRP